MKKDMIIRAWKDPQFRAGLSAEERAALPECPAGKPLTDLDEGSLADVVGGYLAPDQNLSDFHPRLTPYISVNPYLRLDKVAAFEAAYQLRY
jgi:mersacidin/lichenicidin family type 2 lantibiotic